MKHFLIATVFIFATAFFSNDALAQKTFDPTKPPEETEGEGNLAEANMVSFAAYRLFFGEGMIFYERMLTKNIGVEVGGGPTFFSVWDNVWNGFTGTKGHPYYNFDETKTGIGVSLQGGAKYFTYGQNFIGPFVPLNVCYRNYKFSYEVWDIGIPVTYDTKINNLLVTSGFGYVNERHTEYNILLGARSIKGNYINEDGLPATIGVLRPVLMFDVRYALKF